MLTVDAYRQAFEEQLQKNKVFLSQLTSMAVPGMNKLERAKAVFRFLLETLNDGKYSYIGNQFVKCFKVIRMLILLFKKC